MIRYIQFDQQFDAKRMQQEVAQLEHDCWRDHYNQAGYEGSWRTLQLRSLGGHSHNNLAAFAGSHAANDFRDTPLLAQCPYLREVIDFFQMEKQAVRLMRLASHAVIKPHHDNDLNFEEGEVRIHVPVITNPGLKFYLEEERVIMEEGSCWYLNVALPHSVRNEGDTARVHLVIDGLVNDWVKDYFAKPAHTRSLRQDPPPGRPRSRHETQQMIVMLRQMQTATADQLAAELEAGLS